jgi:hypothetical protein
MLPMRRSGWDSPIEQLVRDIERQTAQFRGLVPEWTDTFTQLSRSYIDAFSQFDTLRQIEDQVRHLDFLTQPRFADMSDRFPTMALTSLASTSLVTDALRALDPGPKLSLETLATDLLANTRLSTIDLTVPMLRAVQEAAADLFADPDRLRLTLESSFAGQLLRDLSDIEAHADDEELPEHFRHLTEVRVFDYINGSSHTGWVLKKYLKRLAPHPRRPAVSP